MDEVIENTLTESAPVENIPIESISQEPVKKSDKWNKWLKVFLVIFAILLAIWWVRAWLTKVWVIPNWFDIEALCPWSSLNIKIWNLNSWDYDQEIRIVQKNVIKNVKNKKMNHFDICVETDVFQNVSYLNEIIV